MRSIVVSHFIVDGGASPKIQLKGIIEDGCDARDYDYQEYDVDSSGDVSLYYKLVKQ